MRLVNYLVVIFALATLFMLPQKIEATTETTIGGNLVATINPKYPKAGELVVIRLQGYGYDIESSRISWIIDKEIELQGIARKEHSFRVGNIGSQTAITIVVETLSGRQIIKNIVFRPAEVDLIWEADTYIPTDYKGAPLPTLGSVVTLTAIPNLRSGSLWIKPENLTFKWKKDFQNLTRESGRGKDSITFTLDKEASEIEVIAESPEFGIIATNKVVIKAFQPEIIIYPIKPLTGAIAEVVGNLFITTNNISGFKVEPYFIPRNLVDSRLLRYEWSTNTNKIPFISRDSFFRFENLPLFEFGSSTISVKVTNSIEDTILGQKSWTVERGRTNTFFE